MAIFCYAWRLKNACLHSICLMTTAPSSPQHIAIVGGGWAGCAAALRLAQRGQRVSLFDAAPMLGGRARCLETQSADWRLDNGQHIAIGAYADSLALVRDLGISEAAAFLRQPFNLRNHLGQGIRFPNWPAPLNALAGIWRAQGWSWGERLALLRWAALWQWRGFACDARLTLAQICDGLPAKVMQQFIAPLCLSALNTPVAEASAQVFLRVLRDAMFLLPKGADFLLPRQDLGAVFPQAVGRFVQAQGGQVHTAQRVLALQPAAGGWRLHASGQAEPNGQVFDQVIVATGAWVAADLIAPLGRPEHAAWLQAVQGLEHRAIATVYASSPQPLPAPMLALADGPDAPAQFVFDRSQLLAEGAKRGGQHLLAFVISVCELDKAALEQAVLRQGQAQLGLPLQAVQTVVEKRATIAATPAAFAAKAHLQADLGGGLWAIGDYLHPVYPSTLEGAVQTALALLEYEAFK